jgi:hypothetical protein
MKIKCISLLLIAFLFNGLTASAQSWLWGEQGSTALKADVSASNVATNRTGNVYQTGGFETSISFGTTTLTSSSQGDAFLVKYDQNGNLLWAKNSKSTNTDWAFGYSVATDDSDNSYITGLASGTVIFEPYTLNLPAFGIFLVKYDPVGNVVWAKQLDNIIGGGAEAGAVVVDNFGHEYVTGDEAFLIKYDRNGNVIWNIPQVNNLNDVGYSVATDIYGNVYISGQFAGLLNFGSYQLNSGTEGVFITKFDSNGNVLWAQQSTNTSIFGQFFNGNIVTYSITVDKSGAVYLTGALRDTITFGSYTFTSPSNTSDNFFVVKYNPSGTIAWGKEAIPLNSSSGQGWGSYSVCADDFNNIYISGAENYPNEAKSASFIFANDTFNITNPDNYDVPSFLLKLDSSGNAICGSIQSGGGLEPNTVTSDSTGKFVYLGGVFFSSLNFGNDSLTAKTGGDNLYVGRWQPCFDCDSSTIILTRQGDVLTSSATHNNQWIRNDTLLEEATSQTYTATIAGWYKVAQNPTDICGSTSDSIYLTAAGINQVSVYPNPTNNQIIVKISSSATGVSGWNLKLIDILGRTIYSMPSLNYTNVINLETLPAAMYFITVTNSTGRTVVPVVKVN